MFSPFTSPSGSAAPRGRLADQPAVRELIDGEQYGGCWLRNPKHQLTTLVCRIYWIYMDQYGFIGFVWINMDLLDLYGYIGFVWIKLIHMDQAGFIGFAWI